MEQTRSGQKAALPCAFQVTEDRHRHSERMIRSSRATFDKTGRKKQSGVIKCLKPAIRSGRKWSLLLEAAVTVVPPSAACILELIGCIRCSGNGFFAVPAPEVSQDISLLIRFFGFVRPSYFCWPIFRRRNKGLLLINRPSYKILVLDDKNDNIISIAVKMLPGRIETALVVVIFRQLNVSVGEHI